MLGRVGARAMSDIDVLSFTSLGEKLIGSPALHERRRLGDPAKAVLMAQALESVKAYKSVGEGRVQLTNGSGKAMLTLQKQ